MGLQSPDIMRHFLIGLVIGTLLAVAGTASGWGENLSRDGAMEPARALASEQHLKLRAADEAALTPVDEASGQPASLR